MQTTNAAAQYEVTYVVRTSADNTAETYVGRYSCRLDANRAAKRAAGSKAKGHFAAAGKVEFIGSYGHAYVTTL